MDRLATARANKYLWGVDFRECYFFAAPHRQRQIYSQSPPPVQRLLMGGLAEGAGVSVIAMRCLTRFAPDANRAIRAADKPWCTRP